jgi:tRNA1(Val) A37 N6-methylase TrmN6
VEPHVEWEEHGIRRRALWRSTGSAGPPARVMVIGADLSADRALRRARSGTALLWRGDYRNARQLLDAMKRRIARRAVVRSRDPAAAFRRHRRAAAERSLLLGRLLVELDEQYRIVAANSPDVRRACAEVYGPPGPPSLLALQEVLGAVGASEWRRRGIDVPTLGARIHPHHGVFAPTRQDYVELVASVPLPPTDLAFDIGTGTGVLAALLVRRGVGRVIATDVSPAAVACATENIERLGLAERITVRLADLFPPGRADLVVCNPPWLPGRPTSPLEVGVYDDGGRMLREVIGRLSDHLTDNGEAWLVLSDLAELLGLRSRNDLLDLVARAGLTVRDRFDVRARPARDARDALASMRSRETITLWVLEPKPVE